MSVVCLSPHLKMFKVLQRVEKAVAHTFSPIDFQMLLVLKQRYFVLGQAVQNDGSEHLIQRLLELNEFTQ